MSTNYLCLEQQLILWLRVVFNDFFLDLVARLWGLDCLVCLAMGQVATLVVLRLLVEYQQQMAQFMIQDYLLQVYFHQVTVFQLLQQHSDRDQLLLQVHWLNP